LYPFRGTSYPPFTGVEKRCEHDGRQDIWQIAARSSTYKKHGKRSALYKAIRNIEKAKAQVRAKVEYPFRVIKRQFGYTKVRFRGLMKNTAQRVTLFAFAPAFAECRKGAPVMWGWAFSCVRTA
jgi:IS5 family transposase